MEEKLEIGTGSPSILKIIYTGDLHGNLEKMKYLATVIKKERQAQKHSLVLDSGDWGRGDAVCDRFKGQPMADIFEYLKYDAVCIGEADLFWGTRGLKKLASSVSFPFLCANIEGEGLSWVKKYVIKDIGGLKTGIIGISQKVKLPERYSKMVSPEEGLKMAMEELKSENIQLYVLLSHAGIEKDRELAKLFPALNIIVGGHSHIKLEKPEKIGNVIITHAGQYGEYLGVLEAVIGSTVTISKKE